jgi:hypothetical protein
VAPEGYSTEISLSERHRAFGGDREKGSIEYRRVMLANNHVLNESRHRWRRFALVDQSPFFQNC